MLVRYWQFHLRSIFYYQLMKWYRYYSIKKDTAFDWGHELFLLHSFAYFEYRILQIKLVILWKFRELGLYLIVLPAKSILMFLFSSTWPLSCKNIWFWIFFFKLASSFCCIELGRAQKEELKLSEIILLLNTFSA